VTDICRKELLFEMDAEVAFKTVKGFEGSRVRFNVGRPYHEKAGCLEADPQGEGEKIKWDACNPFLSSLYLGTPPLPPPLNRWRN
jgi:hypothetical protein